MLQILLASILVTSSLAVLMKDPPIFPCRHYDLFDPITRIISDGSVSTPDDFEIIAHQVVQQLNARSNSLYKSMLGRLASYKSTENGTILLSLYQAESRCRNNGKTTQSLVECPFKENGRVEKCNVTVIPGLNRHVKLDRFTCKPAQFKNIFGSTIGLLQQNTVEFISNSQLLGFRAPTLDNFKCFTLRFEKTYKTGEEKLERFRQFQKNMKLAYLLQITEQGTGIYGPTKFGDYSAAEFQKFATGLKPNRNWRSGLKTAKIPVLGDEGLPEAFDWRNKSAVTPVKDQAECGSCWAFSTTGNIEGQWAIKKGKLVSLSEQELVDCDSLDQGCGGGLPSNAYKAIIQLGGLEGEGDYPYDGRGESCSFKTAKAKVYINSSVEISSNETEMAQWLVSNGPISIGINANAMMLYIGGISHPWKIVCSASNLDHGVLIVGYGKQGKSPYWIVKNSWGPGWGVKGYYLVYRGDGTCGLNQMCTSAIVL